MANETVKQMIPLLCWKTLAYKSPSGQCDLLREKSLQKKYGEKLKLLNDTVHLAKPKLYRTFAIPDIQPDRALEIDDNFVRKFECVCFLLRLQFAGSVFQIIQQVFVYRAAATYHRVSV